MFATVFGNGDVHNELHPPTTNREVPFFVPQPRVCPADAPPPKKWGCKLCACWVVKVLGTMKPPSLYPETTAAIDPHTGAEQKAGRKLNYSDQM